MRIACPGGRAALVQLPGDGPLLTAWHPVLDAREGRWRFPAHLGGANPNPDPDPNPNPNPNPDPNPDPDPDPT